MNKVHQTTRELIASLPDRDIPAVRHLLACEDCAWNALESLARGPRGIEGELSPPAPGGEEVLRRLATFPPELLQAFRERQEAAEALLKALIDLPAAERLSAVLREERFRELHLAELLLEKSLRAQPQEARRSEEMARLAYAVALRSGAKAGGEYSASLKVRACCLLGNALRLLGDLEAADRSFQMASRYFGGALDGPERRMFNEMVAHLRLAQGRVDEALALLGRAGSHRQGICLAWAGLICLDQALLAFEAVAREAVALESGEALKKARSLAAAYVRRMMRGGPPAG